MRRPISANATSRASSGHLRVADRAGAATSTEVRSSGPSSVGAGIRNGRATMLPISEAPMVNAHPEAVPSSGAGVLFQALRVEAEHDRHEQRREQRDDQHAQVLHERHEAVVGPEVAGHRDDPGGAAGDHAQRRGRRGRAWTTRASTMPAPIVTASVATLTRITGIQRAPEPGQHVGLQERAERDAGHRLPDLEADRGQLQPPGRQQRVPEAGQQRREQIAGRHADLP